MITFSDRWWTFCTEIGGEQWNQLTNLLNRGAGGWEDYSIISPCWSVSVRNIRYSRSSLGWQRRNQFHFNWFWWLQHLEILEISIGMLVRVMVWDNLQKWKRYFLRLVIYWIGGSIHYSMLVTNFKYLNVWSVSIWNRWGYCSVIHSRGGALLILTGYRINRFIFVCNWICRWTPVTLLEAKSIRDMPHFNHEGFLLKIALTFPCHRWFWASRRRAPSGSGWSWNINKTRRKPLRGDGDKYLRRKGN